MRQLIASPPVSPRQMSLNITTGRNLENLYAAGTMPDWTKDNKQYMTSLGHVIERISERYYSVYGDCFLEKILQRLYKLDGSVQFNFSKLTFQSNWTVPEAAEPPPTQVRGCLLQSSAVKLIAIVLGVYKETEPDTFWGHAELLIINKVYRTIELYDPNGAEFVLDETPNYMSDLTQIFQYYQWPLDQYTFVPVGWTNSKNGLQVYESINNKCFTRGNGLCATWVFYYAELRAREAGISPRSFRRKITRRLNALQKEGIDITAYMRDMILDYLMEVRRI